MGGLPVLQLDDADGGEGVDEARVGVGLLLDDAGDEGLRAVQQRLLRGLLLRVGRLRLLLLLVLLLWLGARGRRRGGAACWGS